MSNLEMEVVEGFDELCAEILENWNNNITHPPMPNPFYTNETQINEITNPNNEFTEKSNDEQIISVLVADTFFDKWLGCGVNGVDLEALNKAQPGNDLLDVLDDYEEGDFKLIVTDNDAAKAISEGEQLPKMAIKFAFSGEIMDIGTQSNPAGEKDIDNSIDENEAPLERNVFIPPSNKTIIDVDIESIEDKKWRKDGVEIPDYFNFGMDEKKWIDYCKLIRKAIAEAKVDPRFYDSHFIIEIIPDSKDSNTKMISGDKIKPLPMDYYNPTHDPDFSATTNRPSNRRTFGQNGSRNTQGRNYYQRSYGNEMMNMRGRQRGQTIRDNNQRNQKRVSFNMGNTNNSANPEQVKIIQEDPEKLKKRSERFQKVSEANATPDLPRENIDTTANNKTSGPDLQIATNTSFPDEEIAAVDSDVYKERPVRKRRWGNSLNVVPI